MATLTSEYQYLGRSSAMPSQNGSYNYYILLYGKTSANQATGIHTVTIKEVLASTTTGAQYYQWTQSHNGKINGAMAFSGSNKPSSAWNLTNLVEGGVTYKTWTVLGEGSVNVDASDGAAKNITLSCYYLFNHSGATYTPKNGANVTVSVTATLAAIPRYLNIVTLEITNKTEHSIVVKWATSEPRNSTYFSFDNGATWIGSATYNETLASDNKSGSFDILDLTANTTYNLKVRFKRADTNLWTESNIMPFTTYNYPHCTSSPDFTIGDALTLDFYNPLGRNISVFGYAKSDGREIFTGNTNGTRLVGFNDSDSVKWQYVSIPNSKDGQYKVVVVYNDTPMTRDAGNVYRIRGNEAPTINGFGYTEGNDDIFAITGNRQHIVQNKSKLLATLIPATPQYWAGSIVKYVVECNGKLAEGSTANNYDLGTIDSANNVELKLTVTDSRGLSTTSSITVTMLEHSDPKVNVTLQRLNNYEDETYLTVDGSISSVNGKNAMTIQYRYKVSGGSYPNSFSTIGDNSKQTLSLDKNQSYIFQIVVTDAFGAKYDKEHVLGKGVFPLFIDTAKNSVGVNKFPIYDKSLEAWGLFSLGERNLINLDPGNSIEIPIFFSLCSGLVNFRMAGANLEVARFFYVFRSNEYFGLHKTLVDESYGNTSSVVPMEMRNSTEGYMFKITNNHSSPIVIRYGILELC